MALKRKITKAEFDALKADVKTEYAVDPANAESYLLDVDDSSGLAAALAAEREANRVAKAEIAATKKAADEAAAEAKRIADEAAAEAAKKTGDITALETSWKGKEDAAKKKGEDDANVLRGQLKKLLVDNVASTMAHEISTAPVLLIPHIKSRLDTDVSGDEPVTRVLDAAGKPSALTIADLKKEFMDNKDFAAIIKGSKGSGSSSGNSQQNNGSADDDSKKLSEMSEKERTEMSRSKPDAFRALVAADKAAREAARH